MNTREFLKALFEFKNDAHLIQIFQTPILRTTRFSDIDAAVTFIERLSTNGLKSNLYFCCGLTDNLNLGGDRRGDKNDIRAVPGLWMDIDIADPLHKKANLPQSIDEAVALIDKVPVKPTLIVNSGHGLHTYWLFKEPWVFENDADRIRFENINFRLQSFIQSEAGKNGWSLDSTYDCTRILRVVGTTNFKDEDNPKPVVLFNDSGIRYGDVSEIENVLPEATSLPAAKVEKEHVDKIMRGISITPTAEPPQVKLEMLLEIDPNFKASWYAKRNDFAKQSPSEYVMSIANLAVRAYWTDQEISDLIVAWYRRHAVNPLFTGNDMKKWERVSYIAHTVAKARDSWEKHKEKTGETLPDNIQQTSTLKKTSTCDLIQPAVSNNTELSIQSSQLMSDIIGWPIVSLIKYEQEDSTTYIMKVIHEGAEKDIKFKTINQLMERPAFEIRFMEVINQKPRKMTKSDWERILEILHLFMKTEKVSDESTTRGRMSVWVRSYLENSAKLSVEHAAPNKDPFIKSGYWYIFSAPFKRWAFHECSFTDGVGKLHLDFKLCGIAEKTVNYTKFKTKNLTSCKAWKIPKNIIDPDEGKNEKETKEKTPVLQLVQTPQNGIGDPMETERVEQIKVG
jgi:hypothetical protein